MIGPIDTSKRNTLFDAGREKFLGDDPPRFVPAEVLIDPQTGLPVPVRDIIVAWDDWRPRGRVKYLRKAFDRATRNVLRTKRKLLAKPGDQQLLDRLERQSVAWRAAYSNLSPNKIYSLDTGERAYPPLPELPVSTQQPDT